MNSIERKHFEENGNFSLFEELINDTLEREPETFYNFDWCCISSMKGLNLDFIRMNYLFLDFNILISTQNMTEDFLIEIIEYILPKMNLSKLVTFDIISKILKIYKNTLSLTFVKKYNVSSVSPIKRKTLMKKFEPKENSTFETIIDYIQIFNPEEYLVLDKLAISRYRNLSEKFILKHFEVLDLNSLITCQGKNMSFEFLKELNNLKKISIGSILTSKTDTTFEFLFNLGSFDEKSKKIIGSKIMKGNLKMVLPETFNHVHWFRKERKIYDDCIIYPKNYKMINHTDTLWIDVHPNM
jgi:hypothetical protein